MKNLLLIIAVMFTFIASGQTNVKPNYTKPYFQGNIKVADTLGVVGHLVVDSMKTSTTRIDIITDTLNVSGLISGINKDGYFNYSDSASVATPIAYTSGDTLKLTNDNKGGQASNLYKPYNVTNLWDSVNNQFDFSELELGDEVFVRFNVDVTTASVNQEFKLYLNLAIGGSFPYSISDGNFYFKTAGLKQIGFVIMIFIGSDDTRLNPAELLFESDGNASITVNSFYISTKRRM